jgi:hypothetical protein
MVKLDDIEAKLKTLKQHLAVAKALKIEAASWLALAWDTAPEDRRRDIEEARTRLANATVSIIHIERVLKEILL